jgi:N-acetylmuramic acid 6-phosphate etherase
MDLRPAAPSDSGDPHALPPTEQFRPGLEDLDVAPSSTVVGEVLRPLASLPALISSVEPLIVGFVETIVAGMAVGGRLVLVGAGTSGQLARSEALECVPTFGLTPGRVIALVAGGFDVSGARFDAAEDDLVAAAQDVAELALDGTDVVLGVSASGGAPYVLEVLRRAKDAGATTLALTSNHGAAIGDVADGTIVIATGPEVPAGSTRMYAGTAQKVVLNTLTTAAMIRLGRTFGSWMVEAPATNIKLEKRAAITVSAITGRDEAAATHALDLTGYSVPAAVFLLKTGVGPAEAMDYVSARGGSLRRSLDDWADYSSGQPV